MLCVARTVLVVALLGSFAVPPAATAQNTNTSTVRQRRPAGSFQGVYKPPTQKPPAESSTTQKPPSSGGTPASWSESSRKFPPTRL